MVISKDKEDSEPNFNADLYFAISVLHKIHNALERWEPLPKSIYEEGKEAIFIMSNWTTNDKEMNDFIMNIIQLLNDQLEVHKTLEKRRKKLWEMDTHKLKLNDLLSKKTA